MAEDSGQDDGKIDVKGQQLVDSEFGDIDSALATAASAPERAQALAALSFATSGLNSYLSAQDASEHFSAEFSMNPFRRRRVDDKRREQWARRVEQYWGAVDSIV